MDRQLILAIILTALVTITRSVLIIQAQSPCVDDNYHLYRGLLYLHGDFDALRRASLNDPPLGEALSAIPAWLSGAHVPDPALAVEASKTIATPREYCYSLPDRTRLQIAVWKAILLLPMAAVVFAWVTQIYGHRSAWLATILLLCEPTLAAHLPLPTVDVLGVEGIIIGCWCAWRFAQKPTLRRGAMAAVAIAIAMLLKHTAIILPAVAVIYGFVQWIYRERLWRWRRILLPKFIAAMGVAGAVVLLLWVMLGFDFSRAVARASNETNLPGARFVLSHRLPMGIYLGSIYQAAAHDHNGHRGYLLGQVAQRGWWYYFPVLATYKTPLGIGLVLLLGLASLIWNRPRYAEISLFVPAVMWTIALLMQHIDIGFRHFLPAYVFWIMLSARCLRRLPRRFPVTPLAWMGAAAAAIHVALWTPDDLSYINFPRTSAYLSISDSNVDWGQSLKQIRRWISQRPDDGRPVYVGYFGPMTVNLYDELGPRLTGYSNRWIWVANPAGKKVDGKIPRHGILILSPVMLSGQYDANDRFAELRAVKPNGVIGHSMLVYDLDEGVRGR